jgi:hypothetical protein
VLVLLLVLEEIDRRASTRTKDEHEHEPWPGETEALPGISDFCSQAEAIDLASRRIAMRSMSQIAVVMDLALAGRSGAAVVASSDFARGQPGRLPPRPRVSPLLDELLPL